MAYFLARGLPVRVGPEHWEFVLGPEGFSESQARWISGNGVGIRAIHRRPAGGRPWWDDLLPYERK